MLTVAEVEAAGVVPAARDGAKGLRGRAAGRAAGAEAGTPPRPSAEPVGSVRIVAGALRGRRIDVPNRPGLRPTGERVREALFDILGQDLSGRRVLDLFAGTGALGFEAASRGAARVVMVEADRELARLLRDTSERLGVAARVRVVAARVEDTLEAGGLEGGFDVILADPPYDRTDFSRVVAAIGAGGLLAPSGVVVLERPQTSTVALPDSTGLRSARTVRYGQTALEFFKYQ